MKLFIKTTVILLAFCFFGTLLSMAQNITGTIVDKSNEPLIGATVQILGTDNGTATDIDGFFSLSAAPGSYELEFSYVSYQTITKKIKVEAGKPVSLTIVLEEASIDLASVQVAARRKTDTDLSVVSVMKTSAMVVSGISKEQIGKSLDKNAAEVVKRVPGVTIQDNRFVVIRGLNQRYNNVWINNAATPSSETDVKAFSFDAVPSNMIDNLMIFKTGAPELTAEATGGFISITTKNIPSENFFAVDYTLGVNEKSSFQATYRLPGTSLDFLGLGHVGRPLPSSFPQDLNKVSLAEADNAAHSMKNYWTPRRHTALPDQKATLSVGRRWRGENGEAGMITSLSYANNYSTRLNMQNNQYERVNEQTGEATPLNLYTTNSYSNSYQVGLMSNWGYRRDNGHMFEFKNLLNIIGIDQSSNIEGWNNYRISNFRYYSNFYSSRLSYNGQFIGTHKILESDDEKIDWTVGFSYANRIEPDRQNYNQREVSDGVYQYIIPDVPSINELGRLYLRNDEYIENAAVNYSKKWTDGSIKPTLKVGAYGEYKSRNFTERSLTYRNAYGPFTTDEINALAFDDLFTEPYLGANKVLRIDEQTNIANSYTASNLLGAAYAAVLLPIKKLTIYGGLRAEYNHLVLNGHYTVNTPVTVDNPKLKLFPSLNMSYNFTDKWLMRVAYARTVNRPEFRELSPLGYYDFTERSSISGNPNLKEADIHNVDLRAEFYPSPLEAISVALFYKNFSNPIEMVSVGTGNNFSYANAASATAAGIEFDIKKSLDFIRLPDFTLGLNASYIYSQVKFDSQATERNRAMQGQSPYVVNASLFYKNDKIGLSTGLMYNVIGQRIMVAAQLNQGVEVIPDIYEQPRHVIDFSLSQKINDHWLIKFGIKDILAQDYITQQTYYQGTDHAVTLTNKRYNLGRTWSIGVSLSL